MEDKITAEDMVDGLEKKPKLFLYVVCAQHGHL